MTQARITPICAYDIAPDGKVTPLADLGLPQGPGYRWLHLDLDDPALPGWCEANLPQIATRSLLARETRPRADLHDEGLVLSLRGVNLNSGADVADMVALRLWVTPSLLVTVRRRRIFAVDDLRRAIEAGDAPPSPSEFLIRLTDGLIDRIEEVSVALSAATDDYEEDIYDGGTSTMPDLAAMRRKTIKLRRHVGPLTEALTQLPQMKTPIFPKTATSRLREIANRAVRSVEELAEVRERLTAMSDFIELAHASRQNRNGYTLSVIASIFLPLSLLTGLFGVNVAGMPGIASPMAFWILTAATVLIGVVLFLVLRLSRWF